MKKLFAPCKNFIDVTLLFNKKDAFLAILVSFILFLYLWGIWGRLPIRLLSEDSHFIFRFPIVLSYTLLFSGLVFGLVKARGMSIASLGFTKNNIFKSIAVAAVVFIIQYIYIIAMQPGSIVFRLERNQDLSLVTQIALTFWAVVTTSSFIEELVFRGFIGPRLYGAFKRKWLSVLLTGLLFATAHGYSGIEVYGRGFFDFTFSNVLTNAPVYYILMHVILHWLHAKYNNIWEPIMLHFFINLSSNFITFA